MVTKVVFKGIDSRGKLKHKTIGIKHDFQVIPEEEFLGYTLPAQSVGSQIIDYLDTVDKSELMLKYDFLIILDYYLPKKRKTKQQEFEEFIEYLSEIIPIDRSVEAIVMESWDVLFGKGKSNKQKALEVLNMRNIAFKVIGNTLNTITKLVGSERSTTRLKQISNG